MKFLCTNCGNEFLKWEGKCSYCGEWDSLKEFKEKDASEVAYGSADKDAAQTVSLLDSKEYGSNLQAVDISHNKIGSGFVEFDRVLGGGIVEGEVILMSGDPGIGKSTLLSQIVLKLSRKGSVVYVSGEESVSQIKNRFSRLAEFVDINSKSAENLLITDCTDVDKISALLRERKPIFAVIDSIQSLSSDSVKSYPGSMAQVRVCGSILTRVAKETGVPIILIGQITKEGSIAGPKVLEHVVDCVLYFEGDEFNYYRMIKGIKNRFGPTNELGIFEMSEKGLLEVANPSQIFIQNGTEAPGSAVSAILKGSRVVFVEVQALTSERTSEAGPLRRVANGIKKPRLDMLSAVISRRSKVFIGNMDVFVNIVGGINIDDPGVDLAVCAAIKSDVEGLVVPRDRIYIGEVGLSGEIRSFYGIDSIFKEASRLGYKEVVTGAFSKIKPSRSMKVRMVKNISEL